ncbi:sulfite exporter TauE/SafE family protein [Paracoccaceae bacterium GXU_MW_L88]
MPIYLPIAEISVDLFVILGLGAVVGVMSGMFGVGGGFILTPLLFFIGVPPAVAVASQTNQVVANSFSGVLAHLRRGAVDLKMGTVLLIGGLIGSFLGVRLFSYLERIGQIDLWVSLGYVLLLGIIGTMMFVESLKAVRNIGKAHKKPKRKRGWVHAVPYKMRFRRSQLYISPIPPALIGAAIGFIAAMLGVGGGFIMLPAMIYILGMPTNVVIGTSLFQILFVTGFTTVLHATSTQTVDVVLAMLLIIGGVIGTQIGARLSGILRPEYLRLMLAVLVLGMGLKLFADLVLTPSEMFELTRVSP